MYLARRITGILFLIFFSTVLFGNEITAVWTRLYNEAASVEQKLAIMENIAEQQNRDMIPVLDDALKDELNGIQNISGSTERMQVYRLIDLILDVLGELKAGGSARNVYEVTEEVDDPFLRAKAIRTIGKIGAVAYADQIAYKLRNINLGISDFTAKEEIETIVSACIESLELLRRPVGFSPVFFASVGGYSARVVSRAEQALIRMVEDPTDQLIEIMTYEDDFEIKYKVLLVSDRSNAPDERKALTAKTALEQGLKFETSDRRGQVFLSQMRTKAAEMLKRYAIGDEEAFRLLDQMVRKSFSLTETLTAIEALGSADSDAAAELLAAYLSEQNTKRKDGFTFRSENVIRATITALGNIGSPVGRPALIEVEFSNWSGDTRRLAKAALEKIN